MDIYVSEVAISEMIGSFVGITSHIRVEPNINILGGIYPLQESDSYFGVINIFDFKVSQSQYIIV